MAIALSQGCYNHVANMQCWHYVLHSPMEAEKGNFSALSSEVKLRSEVNLRSEAPKRSEANLRSEAPKRNESPK